MSAAARSRRSAVGARIAATFLLFGARATAADDAAIVWHATTWAGGPAWSAEVGAATAIVSRDVGRLIWFGPRGGDNLLYVPEGGSIAVYEATLHGGHQFWLGPQDRWRWPPPAAWEAACESADVDGATLTLRQSQAISAPTLVRTYRVEELGLRCGVRWSDADRPWQALHVIQVSRAMVLDPVTLRPSAEFPRGCRFDVEGRGDVMPGNCVIVADQLRFAPSELACKVFLGSQSLRGTLGAWTLGLHPGAIHGRYAGDADHGFTTEIYLSRPERPYVELEQCSDLLFPDADGYASVDLVMDVTAR